MGLALGIAVAALAWFSLGLLDKSRSERQRRGNALGMAIALALLALLLLATGKLALSGPVLLGAAASFMRYRGLFARLKGMKERVEGPAPPPAMPRQGDMSREEALAVLGLRDPADEAAIRAAHRRLIQQLHPDQGGSDYLAAKINRAKDVLIGKS